MVPVASKDTRVSLAILNTSDIAFSSSCWPLVVIASLLRKSVSISEYLTNPLRLAAETASLKIPEILLFTLPAFLPTSSIFLANFSRSLIALSALAFILILNSLITNRLSYVFYLVYLNDALKMYCLNFL